MGKRRGRIEQSRGGEGGEEEDENYIAKAEVNERKLSKYKLCPSFTTCMCILRNF